MFARPRVRTENPFNPDSPLNKGRSAWWLVVPWLYGGGKWFDLKNAWNATVNGTTNVWQPTVRPGGAGQFAFDGTTTYAAAPVATLVGRTAFTLAFWGFRAT